MPLQEMGKIYKIAEELFLELVAASRLALRLVGVKASELVRSRPLALFEPYSERPERLGQAIDRGPRQVRLRLRPDRPGEDARRRLRLRTAAGLRPQDGLADEVRATADVRPAPHPFRFQQGPGRASRVEEAASWAAEQRLPAAALADIGNVYGWGKWKRAAPAAGFKPLFGCELEVGGRPVRLPGQGRRRATRNLMEIFNRKEVRSAGGLVAIHVPAGKGDVEADGEGAAPGCGAKRDDREALKAAGAGRPGAREAGILADLREKMPAGDLYLGGGVLQLPAGGGDQAGRAPPPACPSSGPTPSSSSASPERLVLLHAIEKKIPYPAGAGEARWPRSASSARTRRRWPCAGSATAPKEALGPDVRGRRKVRVRLRGHRAASLPADLFPRTLRESVMARLTAAKDLSWKERQRARRELAVVEQLGLRPVLPHRPRRRRVRPPPRHPPQPARVRGLVLPGLAPRHLPRQPHRVRPLLRALPQPRPARPARHRHRFRLAAPRRGPDLRPRAVRRAAGRARPSSAA